MAVAKPQPCALLTCHLKGKDKRVVALGTGNIHELVLYRNSVLTLATKAFAWNNSIQAAGFL